MALAAGCIIRCCRACARSLILQDMAEAFSQPDTQSDVLFQSELGVVGKLLQCLPDWCRVSVEGEKGWLRKSSLWGVKPDETYP